MNTLLGYSRRLGLALGLVISLAACGGSPQAASVAGGFSDLLSGSTATAELQESRLFVIQSADQARQVADWLEPDSAATLLGVDYRNRMVIMAFWGPNPSTGYTLAIENISLSGKEVRLTARLNPPPAGAAQSDVVTFAYHAVTVPRPAAEQLSGTTWSLYDTKGNLLGKVALP